MLNFNQYNNVTKISVGNKVTISNNNFSNKFYNLCNLINCTIPYKNVTNMERTYCLCYNLTDSPICGNNVTNMHMTYIDCWNLTGKPVCGPNVTDMSYTYHSCYNLTGSPVYSNNIIDMCSTYYNCYNLTGIPVCGNNVTSMYNTYCNCYNLNECTVNWYAPNINGVQNCFYGKNKSRKYNIHVPANSITFNTMIKNISVSLVGPRITWTNNGICWYNTEYNIYIYPDL